MKLLLSLFLTLAVNQIGFSQSFGDSAPLDSDFKPKDVIIWTGLEATQDTTNTYTVGLRLETKNGFSIYKSKLKIEGPTGFKITGGQYPQSKKQKDPLSGKMVEVYYAGDTILKMESLAAFEGSTLPIKITSLGCTERICLFPYTQTVYIPLYKGEESEKAVVDSDVSIAEKKMQDLTSSDDSLGEENILSLEEEFAERLKDGKLGLGLLLLVVFLGGIATNLTPCVFPMIPITIRLLGTSGKPSFINSFIYASGIVVTYSAIGTMAALSGGLFGALLANVWVNVIFAVLFFILGLSMLGFAD